MRQAAEVAVSILVFIVIVALSPIIIPLMVLGFIAMAKMNEDIW